MVPKDSKGFRVGKNPDFRIHLFVINQLCDKFIMRQDSGQGPRQVELG